MQKAPSAPDYIVLTREGSIPDCLVLTQEGSAPECFMEKLVDEGAKKSILMNYKRLQPIKDYRVLTWEGSAPDY